MRTRSVRTTIGKEDQVSHPSGADPAPEVDPVVVDAVAMVRDRFGADGLRDLVRLAQQAISQVDVTMAELADLPSQGASEGSAES